MARWLLVLCTVPFVSLLLFSQSSGGEPGDVLYKKVWNPKYHRWEYVQVIVKDVVPNVYHYEYNLDYSQAAAQSGNTVYAAPVLDLYAYSDGDLGAIIDARSRQLTDASSGLDRVTTAIQSRDSFVAIQNQQVVKSAVLQALTELVGEINRNSVQVQVESRQSSVSQGVQSGSSGLPQGSLAPEVPINILPTPGKPLSSRLPGPLTLQYCNSCHGSEGSKQDKFSLASLGLDATLEAHRLARQQVLKGIMPKGVQLADSERIKLALELDP